MHHECWQQSQARSAPDAAAPVAPPQPECPGCGTPLSSGGSLLCQGDRLVHASCWRDADAVKKPPAKADAGPGRGPASSAADPGGRAMP
jgi:hypothetical protein